MAISQPVSNTSFIMFVFRNVENKPKIFDKKDSLKIRLFILVLILVIFSMFFLSVLVTYQNIYAFNWLTNKNSLLIWHFSLLVNVILNAGMYFNQLKQGKI